MLYSMTGFGRFEEQTDQRKISVEIKSVNHRYFECSIRTPRLFHALEPRIRSLLRNYSKRGKLDVSISCEEVKESASRLVYHEMAARSYVEIARRMERDLSIKNDLTVSGLMRFPDVITSAEEREDEEELWQELEPVLCRAAEAFLSMRESEGARLGEDLIRKLKELEEGTALIQERSPQILEEYKQRLMEKTRELLDNAQLDESRLAAEVVLFADKICTDEETVRLLSHIEAMRGCLKNDDPVGRKLDFLAQEMNREANTILSKSNDRETSERAVELKTSIEKIREQIQNIE